MNNETAFTIFNYGDKQIEAIQMEEGPAFSDEQIGIAIGYADPIKAINNLVKRNEEELEGLATFLNLGKVEGDREVTRSVRVWGEKGVMAITFLARTKAATDFRKYAREKLYADRHTPRDPFMDLAGHTNSMARSVDAFMSAATGRFIELNQIVDQQDSRLTTVEERQKQIDPQAIEHSMHFLRKSAALLVTGTKGKPQPVTYRKYWNELGNLIGISSFKNRAALTVSMMEKCVEYAKSWCDTRCLIPPSLFGEESVKTNVIQFGA